MSCFFFYNFNTMNNDYKKYGLIRRIFSWKAVYAEITSESERLLDEANKTKAELDNLRKEFMDAKEEIGKAKNMVEANQRLEKTIEAFNPTLDKLREQITALETINNSNDMVVASKDQEITSLKMDNSELKTKVTAGENLTGSLKTELDSLREKIHVDQKAASADTKELLNIFKKTTGAAGKIAELRLEDLITKTAISSDNWTTNLMVGSETVEFAIKAEEEKDKWVPVDSKLVGAFTEGEEIVVNEKYIKDVKAQAKKVSKYLNKRNTTAFGIMVLQSDFIYNEIYEHFPEVLTNSIIENSVFIMSPSTFVQFSTAINKLATTFEKAKKASEVTAQLSIVIGHVNKLLSAWNDAFKKLEAINNTHIKNIDSSTKKVESLQRLEAIEAEEEKE